jgi:hypothetical protein
MSSGCRQLRLGPEFRVAVGAGLHAELDELLRDAIVREVTTEQVAASA